MSVRDAESRFADSTHCAGVSRDPMGGASPQRASSTRGDGSGAPSGRLLPAVLVAAIGLLLFALSASSASAALRHSVWTNEFGPDGTATGGFESIVNVGFEQTNNRVIVGTQGSSSNVFSITVNSPGSYTPVPGFPISATMNSGDSDIAVSSGPGATAGYIYTNNSNPGYVAYTAAGVEAGTFNIGGEICGLATDDAGNLWAGNYGTNKIEEFPPGGGTAATLSFSTGDIGRVCKLTVDPVSQDVYAMPWNNGPLYQYTAASGYTEPKQIFGNGFLRMAVNGAKHVLYVTNDTETIYAISTITGQILEEITPGGGYRGVSVDESDDTLYAFAYGTQRVREIPLALVPKQKRANLSETDE